MLQAPASTPGTGDFQHHLMSFSSSSPGFQYVDWKGDRRSFQSLDKVVLFQFSIGRGTISLGREQVGGKNSQQDSKA